MSALASIAARWNAYWFAPSSAYPVAAFRILIGGYLCVYLGVLAPHVTTLFSSEGVYVPYLVPDYAPPSWLAWLLFAALWSCSAALMLGLRSSVVIPCLLALYAHHYFIALAVKHSTFERLLVIYLLALWGGQPDRAWAVSAPRSLVHASASAFTARLVRFQTVMLYLGAALWKLSNPAWHSGILLKSTLQGIWATPIAFSIVQLGFSDATWALLSRCVILGELAIGLCLCVPQARPLGIVLGTLFHIGNATILSIPEFLVCLAPYVFFVSEPSWQRIAQALARVRERRATA